jgi:hypothetical protein
VRKNTLWDEYCYEWERGLSQERIIEEIMINQHVLADYGNERIYKIRGYEKKMTPRSPFPNPTYKSYADYYLKRYKLKIRDMDQFLVYAINRKRLPNREIIEEKIHLVPELLKPTGMTDFQRGSYQIMRQIS